jgi:hypothetical protein
VPVAERDDGPVEVDVRARGARVVRELDGVRAGRQAGEAEEARVEDVALAAAVAREGVPAVDGHGVLALHTNRTSAGAPRGRRQSTDVVRAVGAEELDAGAVELELEVRALSGDQYAALVQPKHGHAPRRS